jgi:hypothetical protein
VVEAGAILCYAEVGMAGSCQLLGNDATRKSGRQGFSYMTLVCTYIRKPHEQLGPIATDLGHTSPDFNMHIAVIITHTITAMTPTGTQGLLWQ